MKSYDNIDDLMKAVEEEWEAMPWYKKAWEVTTMLYSDVVDFFRHDLLHSLKNFWYFKGVIFKFRPWDFEYNLDILAKSLEQTRDDMANDSTRYEQVAGAYANAMDRAIEIIHQGEFEDEEWDELWTIFKGSGNSGTLEVVTDGDEEVKLTISDGTDMRRWWT